MGIVFGHTGTEEPDFKVVKKLDGFAVCRYPPYIIAEVKTGGNSGDDSAGFNTLAKYIGVFGAPANVNRKAMEMTSPVIMNESVHDKRKGEVLQMTAPVLNKTGGGTNSGTMAFVMPFDYTLATLPRPTDARISLREVHEKLVAVKQFTGYYTEGLGRQQYQELMLQLGKHDLCDTNNMGARDVFTVAQYHPPFTIGFLRRNEIWVTLDEKRPSVQKLLAARAEEKNN